MHTSQRSKVVAHTPGLHMIQYQLFILNFDRVFAPDYEISRFLYLYFKLSSIILIFHNLYTSQRRKVVAYTPGLHMIHLQLLILNSDRVIAPNYEISGFLYLNFKLSSIIPDISQFVYFSKKKSCCLYTRVTYDSMSAFDIEFWQSYCPQLWNITIC